MRNTWILITLTIIGLLIINVLLVIYWSKLSSGEKFGIMTASIFFLVPLIITIITNSQADKEFLLLNKPHLEPSIKLEFTNDSISRYLLTIQNNGNVNAQDVVYTIERRDKGFEIQDFPTEIAPRGKSSKQIQGILSKNDLTDTKVVIYYKANLKNKNISFESTYYFRLNPNIEEFNYYSAKHLEKNIESIETENIDKLAKGLDTPVGTINFWFNHKEIQEARLLSDSKTKKIYFLPNENLIVFSWQIEDNTSLNINSIVPEDTTKANMYTYTWSHEDNIYNSHLYINGKSINEVKFKKNKNSC